MPTSSACVTARTESLLAKLGVPFVRFLRDDESVATNHEASKSLSLSGLNTSTIESAPIPCIYGSFTFIDTQSSSISSTNTTTATTASTACGNAKAESDFVSDDEPYITTPKTVVTSSYDYSDLVDSSKDTGSQFASHGNDEDVHACYDIFAIDRCEDDADCPFCVDETDYISDTDDESEWIGYPQISYINDLSDSENDSNSEMSDGDFDSDSMPIESPTGVNLEGKEMSLSSAMQVAALQNYVVTKFGAKSPILYVQTQPNTNTATLVTKPEGHIVEVSPQELKTLKCGTENKQPNTNTVSLVAKPEGQLEIVPKEFEVTPRKSKTVTFADNNAVVS